MMQPGALVALGCFYFRPSSTRRIDMKIDLGKTLSTLGWNVGFILVFSAVLALFGVSLDTVLLIAESMVGLQLLFMLCINVGKWAGIVTEGTAGKWSAVLNLVGVGIIASALAVNPAFDFTQLDAQLVDIARFGALIFGYIVQIAGTKNVHQTLTQGLGVKAFSKSVA